MILRSWWLLGSGDEISNPVSIADNWFIASLRKLQLPHPTSPEMMVYIRRHPKMALLGDLELLQFAQTRYGS